MEFIGIRPISHPSDLIRMEIEGFGVIDLYNEARLIEYAWSIDTAKFRVSFQLCGTTTVIDLIFTSISTVETIHDLGPIDSPSSIEFIRFVFGVDFLNSELDSAKARNVEFATNLVDYRFRAESLHAFTRKVAS